MKVLLPLLFSALTAPLLAQSVATTSQAETIFYNGHILTGEGLLENHPRFVSALAVKSGKVLEVGEDASVLRLAGDSTQKVDLRGAFVMPGLIDAHTHLGVAGATKLAVPIMDSTSLEDMKRRIHEAASHAPSGHWLGGFGWDHTLWKDKALPSRRDLDAVTGDHPAIFERIDGHIAVANSAALAASGITPSTPDPAGGKIDHDNKGEPTGILRETAMALVHAHIPPATEEERSKGLQLAISDAISHGVTSVQDGSDWQDFLVMEELEKQHKLAIRITEWLSFETPIETLKQRRASHMANDPQLHLGMLKGFMDGSLGSKTAAMKAPYADDAENSGIPRYDQETLNKLTKERIDSGFQIGFHAIGDRAASMALLAYANAGAKPESRNRIEHAQIVDPADLAIFKQLGVIASMQPNHLLTDMNWAESRLGKARAAYSYAWKTFLQAGIPLAFGTDYPVEPISPFRGIYAATRRKNEAGSMSYYAQDVLSIGQALYTYTQGSAYAEFAENTKGKLLPGYYADLVVLNQDLTQITAERILATKVLRTVVGGKTIYLAEK